MRRETKSERAAWTDHVEHSIWGAPALPKPSKYGNERAGKYASKREADVAVNLEALHSRGLIQDLREQVRIVLVPGNGKLRPVVYIADFTYSDERGLHVIDAKGFKTQIYRLKKRMAALLLGITIEEV